MCSFMPKLLPALTVLLTRDGQTELKAVFNVENDIFTCHLTALFIATVDHDKRLTKFKKVCNSKYEQRNEDTVALHWLCTESLVNSSSRDWSWHGKTPLPDDNNGDDTALYNMLFKTLSLL